MSPLFSSRVAENANRRSRLIFDTPAHVPVPAPSDNDINNNNNSSSNASAEGAGAESKPNLQRLASWMQHREDPFGADVPTPLPPLKLPSSSAGSGRSLPTSNSNPNSNAESSDIIHAPRLKRENAQGEGSISVSVFPPGMERQTAHSGEDSSEIDLPPRMERQVSHSSRRSCSREAELSGVGTEMSREDDMVDSDSSQPRISSFDSYASQIEKTRGITELRGSDTRKLPPQAHFPQITSSKSMIAGLMPMPAVLLAGTNAVPMLSTLANGMLVNQIPFGGSADGRSVTVAVALPGNRDGLSRRKERRKLRGGGSAGRKQRYLGLDEVDIPLTPFNPFGDIVDDTELRQSQSAGDDQSSDDSLRTKDSKKFPPGPGIFGGAVGEDMEDGNDADDERLDALSEGDKLSEDEGMAITESSVDEMDTLKFPILKRDDYFNGGVSTLPADGTILPSLQIERPIVRLPRSTSVGGKPALHHSCIELLHAPISTPLPLSISRPLPPTRSLSEHNRTRRGLRVVPSIVVSSSPKHASSDVGRGSDVRVGDGLGLTNQDQDQRDGVEENEETKKVYLGGAAKQVQTVQAPSIASQCATPIQMHHDEIQEISHVQSTGLQKENGNGIEEVRRSAFISRENLVGTSTSTPSGPHSHNYNAHPSEHLTRLRADERGDEEVNGNGAGGRLTRSKTFGRNVMGRIRKLGHMKKRSTD